MHTRFTHLSRGLVRQRGAMNRTESRYAAELESLKLAGEIAAWWFEPMSLRLSAPEEGQPARFTPDFMVLLPDGTTFLDDVKGGGPADKASGVRVKCAAERFSLWRFRVVTPVAKRDGGGWKVQEV